MKRTDIIVIAICSIAVLTASCSQGTLATSNKSSYYGEAKILSSDVEHIERLVKSRFLTPLAPHVNLRSVIRMYAQQQLHSGKQDITLLHDDIFWLNWAADKYPANMRPQLKEKEAGNGMNNTPYGRIEQ